MYGEELGRLKGPEKDNDEEELKEDNARSVNVRNNNDRASHRLAHERDKWVNGTTNIIKLPTPGTSIGRLCVRNL